MNFIKFSVYDIFAYALPGIFILLSAILLYSKSIQEVYEITLLFNGINMPTSIFLLILAYVLGLSFASPSRWYFSQVGCNIFGNPEKKFQNKYSFDRHQEYSMQAILREKSPQNYAVLDAMKLVKNMCHNLSFAFLIFTIAGALKVIFFDVNKPIEWYFFIAGSFSLNILLLHRSVSSESFFYSYLVYFTFPKEAENVESATTTND